MAPAETSDQNPDQLEATEPIGPDMTQPARPARLTWLTWQIVVPLVAVIVLALGWGRELPVAVSALIALVLCAVVLSAVQHAEVVAHRVGEPYGSILLAVAVTIIEVGLIVMLMLSGGPGAASLARDTVFAAVMITLNGIVGLSIISGTARSGVSYFNAEGTGGALATVITLAGTCLVLPSFTLGVSGPEYTGPQLTFAAIASLVLYAMFIVTQTKRHRDFFLPVHPDGAPELEDGHADPPSDRQASTSAVMLVIALVAVVGLAKVESPAVEAGVAALGFPPAFVGVVIALLVLAPETLAAVRAARRKRLQTSLNLATGSAMASIGLTIPTIALLSIWLPTPLQLGLGPTHLVLLAMTVVIAVLTVVPGRATRLQGGVHLIMVASYVFLTIQP